jgi:nicotinate-nucleotide adenylyltransferase
MNAQEITPLNRLRLPLPADRRAVALVFNGTFCPIHNNHLRLLETARRHLEDVLGWYVVGGWLMVTHDDSCRDKLGSAFVPARQRARMCELAVEDGGWLMVDRFQFSQAANPGAAQSKRRLERLLREKVGPDLAVLNVCGTDLLPRLRREFPIGVVCVVNRPPEYDLDAYLASEAVGPHAGRIIVVRDLDSPALSSTQVRERIAAGQDVEGLVHPNVLAYHRDNGITYTAGPGGQP